MKKNEAEGNFQNFKWSLEPITVLMTFFGQEIVLDSKNKQKREACSFLILVIGVIILVINIVINTMSFISLCNYDRKVSINGYVGYITTKAFQDFVVVGIPLSFTVIRIFSRRWQKMLSTLESIQSDMNLSKQIHRKIRYCAFVSILFFVLVSFRPKKKLYFFFFDSVTK